MIPLSVVGLELQKHQLHIQSCWSGLSRIELADFGAATRYRFGQERVRQPGREQAGQWLRAEGEGQQSFV